MYKNLELGLYENFVDGIINKTEYTDFRENYRGQIEEKQAALQRLAVYQLDRLDRIEAAMAEMTNKDMQVCVSGMPLTQEYITTAKQNADPKAVCAMNNVDLIVAGGYCGGQWRIPGMGALYVPELGWFPEDSQVQGLNFFGGIWQYVSPGLGKGLIYPWWMGFRLFNSPAVTTITLSKNIS